MPTTPIIPQETTTLSLSPPPPLQHQIVVVSSDIIRYIKPATSHLIPTITILSHILRFKYLSHSSFHFEYAFKDIRCIQNPSCPPPPKAAPRLRYCEWTSRLVRLDTAWTWLLVFSDCRPWGGAGACDRSSLSGCGRPHRWCLQNLGGVPGHKPWSSWWASPSNQEWGEEAILAAIGTEAHGGSSSWRSLWLRSRSYLLLLPETDVVWGLHHRWLPTQTCPTTLA